MITQKEMAVYLAEDVKLKTAASAAELRKKSLTARVDAHEEIEPGSLTALVISTECRRFSAEALETLLGVDKVIKLKAQLPLSVSRSLKIQHAN